MRQVVIRGFATSRTIKRDPLVVAQQKHAKLSKEIYKHRELYEAGIPKISDAKYDKRYRALLELEEKFGSSLCTIESPSQHVSLNTKTEKTIEWRKTVHLRKMLGLENSFDYEGVKKFFNRIHRCTHTPNDSSPVREAIEKVYCDMKYDGMAISLVLRNGKPQRAITRGNGEEGEDVTSAFFKTCSNFRAPNVDLLQSEHPDIYENIRGEDSLIEIRGELIMSKNEFENYNLMENNQYSSARSLVVGYLNRTRNSNNDSTSSSIPKFEFIAFDLEFYKMKIGSVPIINENVKLNHHERLEMLKKLGISVCPYGKIVESADECIEYIKQMETNRGVYLYEMDGVVLKVVDPASQKALGFNARSPKWALAYKFSGAHHVSKLNAIELQISRTGRVTPVGILDPIHTDHATITKVSLHNFDFVLKHNVSVGETVVIERRGGAIPKIIFNEVKKSNDCDGNTGNITDEPGSSLASPENRDVLLSNLPDRCPCPLRSQLKREINANGSIHVYCDNISCPEQLVKISAHFLKCLGVNNVSEAKLSSLIQHGIINTPADCFYLKAKSRDIINLHGWGERSTSMLIQDIENAKVNCKISNIVEALSIPGVATEMAKRLEKVITKVSDIAKLNYEELEKLGISKQIALNIEAYFKKSSNQELIAQLFKAGITCI